MTGQESGDAGGAPPAPDAAVSGDGPGQSAGPSEPGAARRDEVPGDHGGASDLRRRPRVAWRLGTAAGVLVLLVLGAGLADAWAARGRHRVGAPGAVVSLQPVAARHARPTAVVVRASAGAFGLLGLALLVGAGAHLRRAPRLSWLATAAALLAAAWALGMAWQRATRGFDLTYLVVKLGTQPVRLTAWDVYLAAALVGAAVAGCWRARETRAGHHQGSATGGRP